MRHQEKVDLLGRGNDKSMLSHTPYLFSNNRYEKARERMILLTKKPSYRTNHWRLSLTEHSKSHRPLLILTKAVLITQEQQYSNDDKYFAFPAQISLNKIASSYRTQDWSRYPHYITPDSHPQNHKQKCAKLCDEVRMRRHNLRNLETLQGWLHWWICKHGELSEEKGRGGRQDPSTVEQNM